MKKIIPLLALLSICYFSFAQTKKLKEGVAEFDIIYPSLTPEMKQMEEMLPKTMTVYFKNELFRMEMSMAMGSTVMLGNNSKKDVTMLMDMMGKKFAMKLNADDMKKKESEMKKGGITQTFKVIETSETKMIAGYKCKKAIIEDTKDGKKEQSVCYYTEDLPKMNNNSTDNPAFEEIKGFLMEYSFDKAGLQMRIVAKSVKPESAPDSLFTIPPEYKLMTQEEIAEMMSGGGEK